MDLGLDITRDLTEKLNADYKQLKKDQADPSAARRRKEKETQSAYAPPPKQEFPAAKFLRAVEPGSPPQKSKSKIDTRKRDAEIAELVSWKRKYNAYISKPQLMKLVGKPPRPGQESVAEYRRCVQEIRAALNSQNATKLVREAYPSLVSFLVQIAKFTGIEQAIGWELPEPELVSLALTSSIQHGQLDTEILEAECELQDWFSQRWELRLMFKTAVCLRAMSEAQKRQGVPASENLRNFAAAASKQSAQ